MKKILNKILISIFCLTLVLGNFLFTKPTFAAIELVRSQDFGTVYYIDNSGVRHAFPNQTTYQSWYGDDFSKTVTVSNEFLQNYPLGKNITIRPGTFLVKIPSIPKVYAVEQGGVLRELANESIAQAIYGKNWAKRVVDVTEVFFENYLIGEPIIHDYTLPDSILYQDSKSGKYYYKNDRALRLFESQQAVLANHFKLSDALVGSRSYFIRSRPITGLDKNIFNPIAKPIVDSRDCENKKLKAAMIFAVDDSYNMEQLGRLQEIQDATADYYAWATNSLSEIDVSYPVSIMFDDGYFFQKRNDGTTEIKNELMNSFYDNNPDVFDFIFVWTNFKIPTENTNEIAYFTAVTNKQEGINRPLLDRSEVYGSTGKLKGIIMMGNISKYHPETQYGLNQALNIVVHEILHNWAAYIEFIDEEGNKSKALLRNDDYQHWSNYASFISPVGGEGWTDNGDGTFTSGLSKMADTNLRQYSNLDLYLMGLIPPQLLSEPINYVVSNDKYTYSNTILAQIKSVTIDQIIKANGKVKCSID